MEECDETQFWFDYLQKINILKTEEVKHVKSEIDQLVKIFSSIKKKLKEKQKGIDWRIIEECLIKLLDSKIVKWQDSKITK